MLTSYKYRPLWLFFVAGEQSKGNREFVLRRRERARNAGAAKERETGGLQWVAARRTATAPPAVATHTYLDGPMTRVVHGGHAAVDQRMKRFCRSTARIAEKL